MKEKNMEHRFRPDIRTSTDLAQAVDHKKLKEACQAMLKLIEDSGYQPPEHYTSIHEMQTALVSTMADALCLVLPNDIFIDALKTIAKQEHPTRGVGSAAWKIAKEALQKFAIPV